MVLYKARICGSSRSSPFLVDASSASVERISDSLGGFAAISKRKRAIGLLAATITLYPAQAASIASLGEAQNGSNTHGFSGSDLDEDRELDSHIVATPSGRGGR